MTTRAPMSKSYSKSVDERKNMQDFYIVNDGTFEQALETGAKILDKIFWCTLGQILIVLKFIAVWIWTSRVLVGLRSFIQNSIITCYFTWCSGVRWLATTAYWLLTRVVDAILRFYLALWDHIVAYLIVVAFFALGTVAAEAFNTYLLKEYSNPSQVSLLMDMAKWLGYFTHKACYGIVCTLVVPPCLPVICAYVLAKEHLQFVDIGKWWWTLLSKFSDYLLGAFSKTVLDMMHSVWHAGELIAYTVVLPIAKGIFHMFCFGASATLAAGVVFMGFMASIVGAIWGLIVQVSTTIFVPLEALGNFFGALPEKFPIKN